MEKLWINENLINISVEELKPVTLIAKSKDIDKISQVFIECIKDKICSWVTTIYDVTFKDNTCNCVIWNENSHDYILEFTFEI